MVESVIAEHDCGSITQVRHLILYGEYDLNVDEKSRLLIPSEIRKQIDPERDGEAFFVITGVNKVPWLYPERAYEDLVSRRPSEMAPSDYSLMFDHVNFALASRVEWDKAGRILIPDKVLKRAGLNKEVTLIGSRDHLELWNRKDWENHRQALEQKIPEIALLAKQQQQQQLTARPQP